MKEFTSKGRTGRDKASNLAMHIKPFGWSGKWTCDENGTHMFARRGEDESLDIYWDTKGVFLSGSYSLAGEKIRMHNVSAAASVARNEPDLARLTKAARRQRRRLSPSKVNGKLPFSKDSSDEQIRDALIGKTIDWVNKATGEINSAYVSNNPKQFKVVRNGHDYIDFVHPVQRRNAVDTYGFRSVYLDSIVKVR